MSISAALLWRKKQTDHGTEGVLYVDGRLYCHTMEPPDRDNRVGLSCIPKGMYRCVIHHSPRFGRTFILTNVEGRSYILFHGGNYGGDKRMGYKTHTLGCILMGKYHGVLQGQRAVLVSKPTFRAFLKKAGTTPFNLFIV